MNKFLLILLIALLPFSGFAQVTVNGRNILVDGELYQIKGICYSPVAIGVTWTPDYSNVDQDITLMQAACINTIRTYSPINDKSVLDKFAAAGIKVIIGFTLEQTQNGTYTSYINTYKDHPAILMWVHGNEFNYHPDWFNNNLSNWYSLLNTAAGNTTALDSNHPVATVHGELPGIDAINACPNVQVWGMNIYRSDNLGTLFTDWAARSDKPMFLGETGGDSYPDPNAPALAIPKLWNSVNNNATKYNGVCSGVCFFEWSDEWWKAGNPNTQDTGGFTNGGVPYDGFANEEYWGIVDIYRNPKPGYNALKTSYCSSGEVTQSPYDRDTPWNIPGKIEAEDYDTGGQDISYYDSTPENEGFSYRNDEVDIQDCVEGGYNIGWTNTGEWLEYTVNVASTTKYNFKFRIATPMNDRKLHVEMNGTTVTTVNIPNTGGWQNWQTVTVNNINLNAGTQILRLFWDNEGTNVNYFEIEQVPNNLPTITISSPANNASFKEGTSVTINANATDSDGSITKVEFYNGANKLGEATTSPYTHTLTGLTPGNYTITATAIDNNNASSSASVSFTIVANVPPTISISSPANNASFKEGTSVTINVNATDSDGSITKVEFYNGANKLGEATASPYTYTLPDLTPGDYTVTAIAFDDDNASATASITLTITPTITGIHYSWAEDNSGFSIFPIPAISELHIILPETSEQGNVVIYDMVSNIIATYPVASSKFVTIPLENYQQGMYIVSFESTSGKMMKRFTVIK
ncbi:MAG TPA: Ig-like domain-containing protein [Cytophagaceae bacterium]